MKVLTSCIFPGYEGSDPRESGIPKGLTKGLTPCIFPGYEGSDPHESGSNKWSDPISDINKIGI